MSIVAGTLKKREQPCSRWFQSGALHLTYLLHVYVEEKNV